MTLAKNSADKKKYTTLPYYRFSMKQNWQLLVLFIILTLFIMLLASYISIDNINDYVARYDYPGSLETITAEKIETRVHSRMSEVSVIGILVGAGLAFISGMTAMSYVNSKKSVGCYHSFPIKRESMFVTETTIPMVYFLLSITAGYAISFLMFAFSFDSALAMGGLYIRAWFTSIVLFLFIYTVILLAGGLTGTTAMKLIMTLFLLFWPIVMYTLIIYMLDINTELEISYYTSTEAYMFISPLVRAINSIVEMYSTAKLTCGFPLIMSAAMYVGAMLLHKYRKSELSGTTVVWKPMFAFVKYAVIFAAAHLGALLFYYMGDESNVTMFFGAVFGAVVALMLMNAIMYRSTRAMFKNMKKFAIFLAATFVFILLVPLNITGLIVRPYPMWYTSSVELVTNECTIVYTDKEKIKMLDELGYDDTSRTRYVRYIFSEDEEEMSRLYSEFSDYVYNEKYGYYDEYGKWYGPAEGEISTARTMIEKTKEIRRSSTDFYTTPSLYVEGIQKPYLGIPLAKQYSLDSNGKTWEYITQTEEYLSQYYLSERIGEKPISYIEIELLGLTDHYSIRETERSSEIVRRMLQKCKLEADKKDGHLYVGNILIEYKTSIGTTDSYELLRYPVYSCDVEILNIIGELIAEQHSYTGEDKLYYSGKELMAFKSEADVIDHLVDRISAVALVNVSTWEAKMIDDADVVRSLIENASKVTVHEWNGRQFVKEADMSYMLLVRISDYQVEIRFRPDTFSNAELADIFASIK